MASRDDGSREAAVRELGEEAVRAAEVEVVRAHANQRSVATFRAMGIAAASIAVGLGLDEAPGRPTLVPPGMRTVQPQERASHSVGLAVPGPGVDR